MSKQQTGRQRPSVSTRGVAPAVRATAAPRPTTPAAPPVFKATGATARPASAKAPISPARPTTTKTTSAPGTPAATVVSPPRAPGKPAVAPAPGTTSAPAKPGVTTIILPPSAPAKPIAANIAAPDESVFTRPERVAASVARPVSADAAPSTPATTSVAVARAAPSASRRGWSAILVAAVPYLLLLYDVYLGIAEWSAPAGQIIGLALAGLGVVALLIGAAPPLAARLWPPAAQRNLGPMPYSSGAVTLFGVALAAYGTWRLGGGALILALSLLCLLLAAGDALLIVRRMASAR